MKYRVGRNCPRNIYIQRGKVPSKNDKDIGRMDTPKLAADIVAIANKGIQMTAILDPKRKN